MDKYHQRMSCYDFFHASRPEGYTIYQYAKLNEYIDRDLTEGLVYEWTNSTEQMHDRYSDEEIKTLWSKLYEINNVDIILIMIYTGLRPTELLVIITPTEPT